MQLSDTLVFGPLHPLLPRPVRVRLVALLVGLVGGLGILTLAGLVVVLGPATLPASARSLLPGWASPSEPNATTQQILVSSNPAGAARGYLLQARHPPARRRLVVDPIVQSDLTIEMFWAPPCSGTRALISWVDPPHGPQHELIQRAEAAAFTQAGKIFVVGESDDRLSWWSLPGGRREAGETLEDTLRRELLEEACVLVRASELVGFQRFRHLNGDRAGRVTTDAMFSVRVEVLPFEPRFEARGRRLMSMADARNLALWANPLTQRFLDRAADAERRLERLGGGAEQNGSRFGSAGC